ncbi:hypothetical protein RRG08_015520 [Elysia crispata]|uniref:Uncharacterized protein n=1 Tax=Elysia crispata TaxID=231223 RepID=A0AAE0YIR9_9GAST|nr:hypothetical protein RRG08_015520 [Elysia crispata]
MFCFLHVTLGTVTVADETKKEGSDARPTPPITAVSTGHCSPGRAFSGLALERVHKSIKTVDLPYGQFRGGRDISLTFPSRTSRVEAWSEGMLRVTWSDPSTLHFSGVNGGQRGSREARSDPEVVAGREDVIKQTSWPLREDHQAWLTTLTRDEVIPALPGPTGEMHYAHFLSRDGDKKLTKHYSTVRYPNLPVGARCTISAGLHNLSYGVINGFPREPALWPRVNLQCKDHKPRQTDQRSVGGSERTKLQYLSSQQDERWSCRVLLT